MEQKNELKVYKFEATRLKKKEPHRTLCVSEKETEE